MVNINYNRHDIDTLYNLMWNIYTEWSHAINGSPITPNKEFSKYGSYPALQLYVQGNKLLMDILKEDFTDEDIYQVVYPHICEQLKDLQYKPEKDIIEIARYTSLQAELQLLEHREIDNWLQDYFIKNVTAICQEFEPEYSRGLCIVSFGYKKYYQNMTSIYNPDIENIKNLYANILGKKSELYKYHLIKITPACEIMAFDPPRLYDSRINKTLLLSNISKELLNIFIGFQKRGLYSKLSVRCSNALTDIFEGKYTLQFLSEAVEFGKPFSISTLNSINLTKLYSKSYNDCLWVKSDNANITFEELCDTTTSFSTALVTQVIHLKYKIIDDHIVITHIDHEFVFYSQEDYLKRMNNSDIKGNEYQKLKSFKIDGAEIPFDIMCKHTFNMHTDKPDEFDRVTESIPFIVFVLKSYFKHFDLIDEYFTDLLNNTL